MTGTVLVDIYVTMWIKNIVFKENMNWNFENIQYFVKSLTFLKSEKQSAIYQLILQSISEFIFFVYVTNRMIRIWYTPASRITHSPESILKKIVQFKKKHMLTKFSFLGSKRHIRKAVQRKAKCKNEFSTTGFEVMGKWIIQIVDAKHN